jgi:hypothetical protein
MFSNKFGVGTVYVFKVGIIRIVLKNIFITSNNFFQFLIPNFLLFTFFLICIIFKFFSQQELPN